jgi:hypothetical protein
VIRLTYVKYDHTFHCVYHGNVGALSGPSRCPRFLNLKQINKTKTLSINARNHIKTSWCSYGPCSAKWDITNMSTNRQHDHGLSSEFPYSSVCIQTFAPKLGYQSLLLVSIIASSSQISPLKRWPNILYLLLPVPRATLNLTRSKPDSLNAPCQSRLLVIGLPVNCREVFWLLNACVLTTDACEVLLSNCDVTLCYHCANQFEQLTPYLGGAQLTMLLHLRMPLRAAERPNTWQCL